MPRTRRLLGLICALVLLAGCAPAHARSESTSLATTEHRQGRCGDAIVRDTMAADAPEGGHRPGHGRRQGGRHPGRRRVDDRRSRHDRTCTSATARSRSPTSPRCCSSSSTRRRSRLDDKLSKWLPDVPHADRVTLGQLAQMTSGYVDYVIGNTEFEQGALRGSVPAVGARRAARLRDVEAAAVRAGHELELRPHQLRAARPGAGEGDRRGHAEAVAGQGAAAARADEHRQLVHPGDPRARAARVHQRTPRGAQDPSGTPFYEESTYWNPSWTITHGAIQTTNIYDMEASAVGIGSGKLLSKESYAEDGVHRPARQDPRPARLHHLRRDERRLHLRDGHRDLRRLAAAEPAVRR